MTQRSFTIANVELAVSGPHALHLVDDDTIYRSFATPVGRERLAITIEEAGTADLDGWSPVFDSGVAWRLYRSNGDRLLSFARPHAPDAWLYSARLQGLAERVTVHCGPRLCEVREGRATLHDPVRYPLDQLLLMYRLAAGRGAIVHAASAAVAGRGWVFAGRSGAGKSTLMRQLAAETELEALGDDRVILRSIEGQIRAFGTPWPGEARVARNVDLPLHAIAFLCQGSEHRLVRLDRREALVRLLPVVSIPWYEPEVAAEVLDLLGALLAAVPAYDLHFALRPGVVDLLARHP